VEKAFCPGCFVSYLLAAGYAGIALFGWQRLGLPAAGRAAGLAAALLVVAFLALLYPGLHTPAAGTGTGRAALEAAAPAAPRNGAGAGTGDATLDEALAAFVKSLPQEALQALSDSLYLYANAAATTLPPPRSLWGPAEAPVRITEFTDVLCDHCAELGEILDSIRGSVPEGSF